ncbi:MAG: hypothetical protein AMS18_09835 [Gemmatimonas sp. SG8_17]|nr:MAG: hypothetical protein AMS18_09835 [Gemmatimonas sp. SG8_17]
MRVSPFYHKPDRELGKALRTVLSGQDEAAFVKRVMARVAELHEGASIGLAWWEVLGAWARPGLAAAALGLLAGAMIWAAGLRSGDQATTVLGDPLQSVGDTGMPAAFLATAQPPNLDNILAIGLEPRR